MARGSAALARFTAQLSMLQSAGVPLVRSLQLLERSMPPGGALQLALARVVDDVEAGGALSDALAVHPRLFDQLYVGAARSGEAGGTLPASIERLAELLGRRERLRRRLASALLYPLVQLLVTATILLGFVVYIVPQFEAVFAATGADLPLPTALLLQLSNLLLGHWPLLLALPGLPALAHRLLVASSTGRWLRDVVVLRIPLVGRLVRQSAVSRYTRSLGAMIDTDVPLLRALTICADEAHNTVVRHAGQRVLEAVRAGGTIAEPLGRCGLADDIAIRMIEIGEESGSLGEMLIRVADACDDEITATLDGVNSLIQPLMIVATGLLIAGVLVAMFLPMISFVER